MRKLQDHNNDKIESVNKKLEDLNNDNIKYIELMNKKLEDHIQSMNKNF